MDETNAKISESRTPPVLKPESDWERARVKWFNRVRGFGFLTRGEGTPDIYVHIKTAIRCGFTELRPDQVVQIRWCHTHRGIETAEIRPETTQQS